MGRFWGFTLPESCCLKAFRIIVVAVMTSCRVKKLTHIRLHFCTLPVPQMRIWRHATASHKLPGHFMLGTFPAHIGFSSVSSRVHEGCALNVLAWADAAVQRKYCMVEKSFFWVHDVLTFDLHFYTNVLLFHNSIFTPLFLRDASTEHHETECPTSPDVAPPAT